MQKMQRCRRETLAITAFSSVKNDTAVDTIVSTAVSDLAEMEGFAPRTVLPVN
jgi:hypothetical protein